MSGPECFLPRFWFCPRTAADAPGAGRTRKGLAPVGAYSCCGAAGCSWRGCAVKRAARSHRDITARAPRRLASRAGSEKIERPAGRQASGRRKRARRGQRFERKTRVRGAPGAGAAHGRRDPRWSQEARCQLPRAPARTARPPPNGVRLNEATQIGIEIHNDFGNHQEVSGPLLHCGIGNGRSGAIPQADPSDFINGGTIGDELLFGTIHQRSRSPTGTRLIRLIRQETLRGVPLSQRGIT